MITEAAVQQMWIVSLVIYAVVLVVVVVLLTLILTTARRIHEGVGAIWVTGQKIANNTVHISMLTPINHRVRNILESAKEVAGATAAIKDHAKSCPGCPACVLSSGWRP